MIIGLKSLLSLVHAQFHMGQKLCLVLVSEIPFPYLMFLLRQRKRRREEREMRTENVTRTELLH